MTDKKTPPRQQGAHPSLLDKTVWIEGILADPDLAQSAKTVAMRLFLHHNVKTGQCNPTLPTLAKGIGLKPRATHTALSALRDAGYVSWVAQKGGRSHYTLERITIGQAPAKVSEPLQQTATPLAADCKGEPCSRLQTNPGISNPGKNPVFSAPSAGAATQTSASRSGNDKVKATFTGLPENFTLTAARRQVAAKHGLRMTADVEKSFAHFVKNSQAKGDRSPNWDAKWEAWCMNRPNKTHQVKRSAI